MEKNMRQLYLTATALLVAGAFAACSSDDDAPMQQPAAEAGPVTIRATITDEPASRIALGGSDGTSTKVLWTNGDAFSLKIGEETTGYTFTTTLTEASATADFTCENAPTLTEGTTVTATYPATLPTSYAEQPGTEAGLSQYLTLTATATATTGSYDDLALSFKHNTSVVKLTLTNDAFASAEVTDITLATAGWSVKATSTFTGSEDGNVTAYLVINSTDALTEATITATCGGASYGAALGGKTLTAGKLYKVTKPMIKQTETYSFMYNSAVLTGLNDAITSTGPTKVKFVAGSPKTSETAYADGESTAYIVTNGDCLEVHTYAKTFQISNAMGLFYTTYHSNFAQLTEIDFNNSVAFSGAMTYCMFEGCSSLTSIKFGESFNTSNVTNMRQMFCDCSALTSLDLSNFNTSNVTDMLYMFSNCSALKELDLSNFNTEKVTDMSIMFYGCSSLTSLNLSSFNTSNVTDMNSMFYNCYALTELDLSSFTFAASNYANMFLNLGKNSSSAKIYVSSDGYTVLTGLTDYASTLCLTYATLEQKTE